MMFCSNCGKELADGAKFCHECGTPIQEVVSSQRETIYDGEIHKCPNCGNILGAFDTICPTCKFELRGTNTSSAVKDLTKKLEQEKSKKQQILIIKNYPIPNTKEDIFEFMLLASSNFDASYYATHLREDDISDAWLAKIEQCYQKAKLTFVDHYDLQRMESLYANIKNAIKKEKAKPFIYIVSLSLGLILIMIPYTFIQIIGLVLFVTGIVLLCKNNKHNSEELSINNKDPNNMTTAKGYSSWSIGVKIIWIILNIYTLGIPALIYILVKNK